GPAHATSSDSFPTRRSSDLQAPRSGAPPHRFYWDGQGLVTETVSTVQNAPQGTMRTKQVRRLDPSGDEMTVQALLVVEHGYTLEDRKSTRLNSSHQIISYAV